MQLTIYSLSKEGFRRLENFCNQANVNMKYLLDRNDTDLYDVSISSIESQAMFRTSVCEGEELIILQDLNSRHGVSIDVSEFHKVVII